MQPPFEPNLYIDEVEQRRWEALTTQSLIEQMLYTDVNMFGEVQFLAEETLKRRFPPPAWAIREREIYGAIREADSSGGHDGTR